MIPRYRDVSPDGRTTLRKGRLALWAACLLAAGPQRLAADETSSRFSQTHSRSDYVHWIELYDAQNRRIDPADPAAGPYSPARTCGRCHDYEAISRGHHFNAARSDAFGGRSGEPWIWCDERTGTQLPLSYRSWSGTYHPDQLGITPWDFVLKFGRHHPGGWPAASPAPSALRSDPVAAENETTPPAPAEAAPDASELGRWRLSGTLEIDCLFCHAPGRSYSPELWWEQIQKQNFAWAPTVAGGLGGISGQVADLPDEFDPLAADSSASRSLPTVIYRDLPATSDNKVFIDIVRRPENQACYYCHSQRHLSDGGAGQWNHDEDVHLRAGMRCVDCHRNGLEHHTVRGFDGELHPSGQDVSTLSCRGCHMDGSAGGRLGAPLPQHRGLPPLHLDRLSCTACHSGPLPDNRTVSLQTAMAHGLGLPTHGDTSAQVPAIVAPVMLQESGVLYPHRQFWPAFWARSVGDAIEPLHPEAAHNVLRRVLRVRRGETLMQSLSAIKVTAEAKAELLGEQRATTEPAEWTDAETSKVEAWKQSQVVAAWQAKLAEALTALQELAGDGSQPVYVGGGQVHRLDADGQLETSVHPAAAAYAWPIAHDVLPARQALGAQGCHECHSDGAPIFEGEVVPVAAVPQGEPRRQTMHEVAGYDPRKLAVWNRSFQGRTLFKYVGFASLGLVGLILVTYLTRGAHFVCERFSRR